MYISRILIFVNPLKKYAFALYSRGQDLDASEYSHKRWERFAIFFARMYLPHQILFMSLPDDQQRL